MKKLLSLLTVIFCFVCVNAQTPERKVLVEEFTSSTCGPCYTMNLWLNPLLETNAEKISVIKYQMSWPGTGDPYYTAEGGTRRTYYGVNAVPYPYTNGVFTNSQSAIQNAINNGYAQPAYVELVGNFEVVGQTVNATVYVRPTPDFVGENTRLYVAIVEKTTKNNKKSNGETIFHHVMKKFMTPATGEVLTLTPCTPITTDLTWEFQGNYRLPLDGQNANIINHSIEHSVEDFNNLEVVVWLSNYSTKQIFNSCTLIKSNDFAVKFAANNPNGGTLTATVNGNPIESGDLVAPGTVVEFTATPTNEYQLVEWVKNYCEFSPGTSNTFSVTVDEPTTVNARFFKSLSVNYNVINGNGTLSAWVEDMPVNTGDELYDGAVIDFTAIPDENYKVKEWKLNGNIIADNTSNNFSFVLTENATVTVEFIEKILGTLVFNPTTENGELIATVDGNQITSGKAFEVGTVVEFTAIPNENFEVKEWKLNNEIVPDNNTNNYSLTIANDATVTVEFVEIVGIKDINGVTISVAPNPVNDLLFITGQYDKLEIFSITGQIMSTASNQPSVDVKHLSKGIYFVKIASNGQTGTFKIGKR